MSGRPIPPRIRAQLADVALDPTGPSDRYYRAHQTEVDNGRLLVEINRLRAENAALTDDVRYWAQRADLFLALWTSIPRRVRRWAFRRYDKAHPLGLEQLR
jgi:phage terminase Nu1 subunit (DNA packaging protein)